MILEQYIVDKLSTAAKLRDWIKERGIKARVITNFTNPKTYKVIAYDIRKVFVVHKNNEADGDY